MRVDVKIDKSLLFMAEKLRDNLKKAVERATLEVKEEVIDNIGHGYIKLDYPPISKNYKKQLERRGLVPHVGLISPKEDKKKLIKSIGHKMDNGGLTGIIFTNRPYAIYVEKGTRKMPARPFFEPAVKKKQKDIERIIKNAIEDSLK